MTAKAIDTRLSEPMASVAKPKVQTRPTISVTKQATISLMERRAANSKPSTSRIEATRAQPMPSSDRAEFLVVQRHLRRSAAR